MDRQINREKETEREIEKDRKSQKERASGERERERAIKKRGLMSFFALTLTMDRHL